MNRNFRSAYNNLDRLLKSKFKLKVDNLSRINFYLKYKLRILTDNEAKNNKSYFVTASILAGIFMFKYSYLNLKALRNLKIIKR